MRLNIPVGKYRFTPHLMLVLITVLAVAIMMILGNWQLERAKEKSTLLYSLTQHQSEVTKPLRISEIGQLKNMQQVQISGELQNNRQLLLDNKFHQHQIGYYVFTPVKIAANKPWVLVNRGWVARPADIHQLPILAPIDGVQKITGTVYKPSNKVLLLGSFEDNPGKWPRIIQRIDFKQIEKSLQHPVYPWLLVLQAGQPGAYVTDWKPVIISPARHYGYAFQWYALALTLVALFIVTNLHKRP